jgi:hypothetical protein
MEIQIKRVDNTVGVFKNLKDVKERGEISHVLMELELIKQELLVMWHSMEN